MQRREGHGGKGLSLWATIKSVQEWSKGRRWLKDRKSRTQETESQLRPCLFFGALPKQRCPKGSAEIRGPGILESDLVWSLTHSEELPIAHLIQLLLHKAHVLRFT